MFRRDTDQIAFFSPRNGPHSSHQSTLLTEFSLTGAHEIARKATPFVGHAFRLVSLVASEASFVGMRGTNRSILQSCEDPSDMRWNIDSSVFAVLFPEWSRIALAPRVKVVRVGENSTITLK